MTLALADLARCFEGVIPSIVATAAADGTPNVSYLSHVVMVDENHVALSNQFFAKTAANVRANPQAAVLLVDGLTGEQFALDLVWETTIDRGELFDRVARDLRVSSAQIGMADVMRLRGLDVFLVRRVRRCPAPHTLVSATTLVSQDSSMLPALADAVRSVTTQNSIEALLEALLTGATTIAGCHNAIVLVRDPGGQTLVTVASRGYPRSGAGSEIALGEGLIGEAAAALEPLRLNDLSRIRRFGSAFTDVDQEDRLRAIALPHIADAMSQIALPVAVNGDLRGVLFLESPRRLAFDSRTQAALQALADQAATALGAADETFAANPMAGGSAIEPSTIHVVSHSFDDSVFIDGRYVIKGVAGRLFMFLLEKATSEGRTHFSNREIRLAAELRLPEFKDNLETRLLLLRRRLEERDFPIRLERVARGEMKLQIPWAVTIERRA